MNQSEAAEIVFKVQGLLGVKQDREWGPITQGALDSVIRISKEVEPAPPPPADLIRHPFILVAREWMGRRETSHNRFPGDVVLWADTSYPNGWANREPYCAAFVCHVIAECVRRGMARVANLPKSASVREFRNWARALDYMVDEPRPGDIFTLLPSGTSHIGFVGHGGGNIHSLEGNTNSAGGREGDGFMEKVRRSANCDFIRIPLLA